MSYIQYKVKCFLQLEARFRTDRINRIDMMLPSGRKTAFRKNYGSRMCGKVFTLDISLNYYL